MQAGDEKIGFALPCQYPKPIVRRRCPMNGQSTYKVVTRLAFLATAGSAPPWGESSLTARPVRTLNNTNSARYTTVRRDGFLDTIATEAFRRAGVQLRLIRVPPERGLLNANQGVEDSDLTRIAGLKKKYPNRVQLDEVLIDRVFAAFSRRQRLSAQWPERR